MSDTVQFSCPQCKGEVFKTAAETKRLEDFYGAVCAGCGRTITEEDIKHQAVEIARKIAADVFKGHGFK